MIAPMIRLRKSDGTSFDDWKMVPFGDVVSEYKNKTKVEDEDILLSSAIDGMYLNSELFGHQRGKSNVGYLKIKKGTLVLSAQNLHLGNANVNMRFDHGIISPAYKTYNIVGCSEEFMGQWIKREETKHFFYTATTIGASECRRNVDWDMLYNQPFYVPSEEEQQALVSFFSDLDEVISASEAEVAALEKQKKGAMQKIFSQEVRFKKDDGSDYPEWEEKALDELGQFVGGGTPSTKVKEYWNGTIPWISSADLSENNIWKITMTRFITDEAVDSSATKRIPKGAILIICRVGVGKVALSPCELCTSQDFVTLINGSENEQFLAYAILKIMQSKIHNVQGTSIKGIPVDEIKKYSIQLPCIEEQRKIADFLSDFDTAIDLAKQELEKWKLLKKGLLQQMFV